VSLAKMVKFLLQCNRSYLWATRVDSACLTDEFPSWETVTKLVRQS